MPEPPFPPERLMRRAGPRVPPGTDARAAYLERGREHRERIESALPAAWTWDGVRVLDFGCGAGRTLRQFLPEAERAELWGCDIGADLIAWLSAHLSPPLHAVHISPRPELPFDDGHFDVIWGLSVFTHIHASWAAWLLELRRVLADDGYLILTVLSDGAHDAWQEMTGEEELDPDRLGMATFRRDAPWSQGGPVVFVSEWWLRAHWGRALTVERFDMRDRRTRLALLRKRPGTFTPEDLERPEPGEPREGAAAQWERDWLRRELDDAYGSRSWRATRPLRRAAGRLQRQR